MSGGVWRCLEVSGKLQRAMEGYEGLGKGKVPVVSLLKQRVHHPHLLTPSRNPNRNPDPNVRLLLSIYMHTVRP